MYRLITEGEIETVRVGTRRLVVFHSLKARLTSDAATSATKEPGRG
jgi:hypothetical protein